MGGVIIILTRGMGERLTYGIPAHYRVVLVERLGCSSTVGALVPKILRSALYRHSAGIGTNTDTDPSIGGTLLSI